MTASLERFIDAQDDPVNGFDTALGELRSGRKRSHWIWYIFPQLRGLGHSPAAQAYGVADLAEAEAYLRHPTLRERLLAAASEVLAQVRSGVPLATVMGSEIDALKLVSSMTLFGEVAARLAVDDGGNPAFANMAATATALLAEARAEGFEPCAYTLARLRSGARR